MDKVKDFLKAAWNDQKVKGALLVIAGFCASYAGLGDFIAGLVK